MLDLIKKDIIVGWIILLGITLLIPFITTMMIMAMIDDFGGLILGVFGLITFGLCIAGSFLFIGVDAAFEADRHFASLPLKRSKMVFARYASAWLSLSFNYGLVILSCLAAIWLFNQSDPLLDRILTWRGIIAPYLMLICIQAYMLPFIFKFSTSNGAFIAAGSQIVFLLIRPVYQLLNKLFPDIFSFDFTWLISKIQTAFRWTGELSTISVIAIICLFIIGFATLSLGISIRFFNRRDL